MRALIDTHAHLDFPKFKNDLDEALNRARQAGVVAIINVGADERSSKNSVSLSKKYPQIGASVGIHPHGAAEVGDNWLEKLEKLARDDHVLAVGEIGLDYYRNLSPREDQERVFREQLRLACRVQRPVIIHNRDAHDETLRVLKEEKLPAKVGVMHCFSGDRHLAEELLDLGFYISVAGPLTYPKSHALRDLLNYIPEDRLLFETDAPYLSPQAYRGKRNEPSYVKLVYERAALALGQDLEQLAEKVYVNAVRLFSDKLIDRI
ncbi:MAG: TatD family hydrolase [Bacillota bacterium]